MITHNKAKIIMQRNRIKNLIRIMNRHKNVLKWGSNETDRHIQMKLEICKFLKNQGEEFYTEAIFEDGSGRADILAVDREVIIEVYDSEKEESLKNKINKYPLPVILVNAKEEFTEELIQ